VTARAQTSREAYLVGLHTPHYHPRNSSADGTEMESVMQYDDSTTVHDFLVLGNLDRHMRFLRVKPFGIDAWPAELQVVYNVTQQPRQPQPSFCARFYRSVAIDEGRPCSSREGRNIHILVRFLPDIAEDISLSLSDNTEDISLSLPDNTVYKHHVTRDRSRRHPCVAAIPHRPRPRPRFAWHITLDDDRHYTYPRRRL